MRSPVDEHAAVVSRVKRQFPDHRVDVAYSVCLPVYELRLRVTEMAEHALSTAARFVLQLANLEVIQPSEIGRVLGLQDSFVTSAAAELLGESLCRSGAGSRNQDHRRVGGRSSNPVGGPFVPGTGIHESRTILSPGVLRTSIRIDCWTGTSSAERVSSWFLPDLAGQD